MPTTEEVLEQVQKEVTEIGATSKENYEGIRKNFEEYKGVLDKMGETDPVTKDQLEKYQTDIITRQDSMDQVSAKLDKAGKDLDARMDQIELSIKRGVSASKQVDTAIEKATLEFQIAAAAAKGHPYSVDQIDSLAMSSSEYKNFRTSFNKFLRKKDGMLTPEDQKALSLFSDPDGGVTVPTEMSNTILDRVFETDPVRQLASVQRITSNQMEWLADVDEADANWEDEQTATANTGTPQFNKVLIPVHWLRAAPHATQTLLEDSAINIENWLAMKIADIFSRTEAAAFVTGNGVARPRGFLTYTDWTTAGTYEFGKVEVQNLGHATAITTDGLLDLKYRLVEAYLTRGTWLMNRLTVANVMKLKDGDGTLIWRPGLQEGQPSLLLGLPLRMATTMPTVAANALSIALADWQRAYMVVDRLGITVQRDPYTAKPFIEFYTRKRVGGAVTDFQAIKIGKIAV